MTPQADGAARQRFAILAVPRTGSTWLVHLLQSHPQVRLHQEPFTLAKLYAEVPEAEREAAIALRQRNPLAFLERLFASPGEHSHVGLKFFLHQNRTALDHLLADPQIRLVVLSRRNRLAEYASWKIAERTAVWSAAQLAAARAGGAVRDADRRCVFVPEQFERYMQGKRSQYEYVHSRLARHGRSAFFLEYERLGDPEVQRRLLDFLGLRTDVVLRAPDRPLNPPEVLARFSNPEAVRDYLARRRAGSARAQGVVR